MTSRYHLTSCWNSSRGRIGSPNSIAFQVYWPEPLHLQPAFEYLGYGKGSLPVSERLCDEVLAVALFPEMTDEEVDIVSDALRRFASIA